MRKAMLFSGFLLAFLGLALPGIQGKVVQRCELVKILRQNSFEGYMGRTVADWVCLVAHESSYNTKAIHDNGSSRDYGIFRINSQYWCDDGKTHGSKNACHMGCSKFLDDSIKDDMQCAKKIAQEAKGLKPWVGWNKHCRGKNLSPYVRGC
ncbi:lysozyme C-like [Phaenicophaeus curvirostris]|uniref:lysozyme C-like n=1 Tax=Phaenicophaeus curvirostris TaxID=33595 RepID=UPI0037F0BE45